MFRRAMFVVVLLFSQAVSASDQDRSSDAHTIINDYKELRRKCATSQGDERVQCFSELKQLNAEYQSAKRAVADQEASDTNVHVVSHVY